MSSYELSEMVRVQERKEAEGTAPLPLDPEGRHVAETKRFSIDLPEYIVKTDPLR